MSQKVHRPLFEEAVNAVHAIFDEGRAADKTIEYYLRREKRWGSRDRRFFAETVYDVTRWWRRIQWCLQIDGHSLADVRSVLQFHVSLRYTGTMPDWLEVSEEQRSFWQKRWDHPNMPAAVAHSLPDWLEELGQRELGSDWPKTIAAQNQTAPVFLRVNTLKSSLEAVRASLLAEEIETEPVAGVPWALRLKERKNVFITKTFHQGGFEVQDAGSQQIAPLLEVEPSQRVVDACAGAGGKSLHLAALMKNKGKILALDIHERKLEQLRLRSRRAGSDIIETRLIDSRKVIKRLNESADRVLLDVPCSGSGVWRRNPDSRWKVSPEEMVRLHTLQAEILRDYSQMVRPGGLLVYATCSLWPSENQNQVQAFLAEIKGRFTLEEELHISPANTEFDGFYGARLRRANS